MKLAPVVFQSKHFTVTQCINPPIPGYLIVTSIRRVTSISDMTPSAQADLGAVMAKGMKLIQAVIAPERIYVLRFGEEMPRIHFHLFPRTKEMLEAYRQDKGGSGPPNGPVIFEWVRKAMATEKFADPREARSKAKVMRNLAKAFSIEPDANQAR